MRWGQGSLQEIDHVPFVAPLTKLAATPETTAEIPGLVDDAFLAAQAPHSGPAFVDFPLDLVFSEAEVPESGRTAPHASEGSEPDGAAMDRAIALLKEADRPVIMAGTNLYWGHGEVALLQLAEERGIPVFLNGMGRGCVPADHELSFSRARSDGLKGADVALIIGVPMDFRLGFGGSFGEETELVVIDRAEPVRAHPRPVAAELYGGLPAILNGLGEGAKDGADTTEWVAHLREAETEKRAKETEELNDPRGPLHPMRLYKELGEVLDRNAIVIGDGGDFVSYAGRVIDTYEPGCWMDPGPFGCLGSGPGYALAAKIAHPDRQVVLLQGDGAFGFAGHGVRHARPPRRERRERDGQQRHLGAREAPDGVPLRLLGRRGAAARHPLRQGRRGTRVPRGARRAPGRPQARDRPCVRERPARPRQRPHRSGRRSTRRKSNLA